MTTLVVGPPLAGHVEFRTDLTGQSGGSKIFSETFENGGDHVWSPIGDPPITFNIVDDPTYGWIGQMSGGASRLTGAETSIGFAIPQPSVPDEDSFSVEAGIIRYNDEDSRIALLDAAGLNGWDLRFARTFGTDGFFTLARLDDGVATFIDQFGFTFDDDLEPVTCQFRLHEDGLYLDVEFSNNQKTYIPSELDPPFTVNFSLARISGEEGGFEDVKITTTRSVVTEPGGQVLGVDAGVSISAPPNLLIHGIGWPPSSPDTTTGPQRIYLPITSNNPDEGPNTRWLSWRIFDWLEPLGIETGYIK